MNDDQVDLGIAEILEQAASESSTVKLPKILQGGESSSPAEPPEVTSDWVGTGGAVLGSFRDTGTGRTRHNDRRAGVPVAPKKPKPNLAPAKSGWQGIANTVFGTKIAPGAKETEERHKDFARQRGAYAKAMKRYEHHRRIRAILSSRLRKPDEASFVAVLSRKGGVGKTTVTALLSWSMAYFGSHDVAAIDVNPDEGNLLDKFVENPGELQRVKNVRKLLDGEDDSEEAVLSHFVQVPDYPIHVLPGVVEDVDSSRISHLESNEVGLLADRLVQHEDDKNKVLVPIAVLDNGTGIDRGAAVGSLMVSDSIVIVMDNSLEASRFLDSTISYLTRVAQISDESGDGRREALSKLMSRVRLVIVENRSDGLRGEDIYRPYTEQFKFCMAIPYDSALSQGGKIDFRTLNPATRHAVQRLACSVMNDLRIRKEVHAH